MFAPANQTRFSLTVEGFGHDLQVSALSGREAISEPFAFDVELVSEQRSLDLEALLHRPAFLQLAHDGSGIHGLIYRVAQGGSGKRLTRYSVTLRPKLAYLAHRINQRIFQNLSVPAIIAQVLKEHGILSNTCLFSLRTSYPERIYCVQYDESDLQFIQRLCEEEGIHYHFRHSATAHTVVFGDDQITFAKLAPVPYQPDSGMVAEEPVIKAFDVRLETRTSRTTRRDYDFEKPRLTLEETSQSDLVPDLEDYDYPGRFSLPEHGKRLAKRALERRRSDFQVAVGESDQATLLSGHLLPMTRHGNAQWNDDWLLTEVVHKGSQPQVLEESMGGDSSSDSRQPGYANTFRATQWEVVYRPALKHPKPRILGSQSAVVTGPKGEEIHCDEYGRVKVQFHWDREGQGDDRSSCWLRTSTTWAGAHYGSIAIPRVGMEVLVNFLEGDPDQPLISGCLYHGTHLVPYKLPANKTRSTFKTLSSPGGGGFNELRIEDKKGQEQIFVHAERNWDQSIGHDQKIRVGNERHDTVEKNSYSEFKADEHHTVHAERKVEVRASDHTTVAVDRHIRAGTGYFIETGREIHQRSGNKIVIEAGNEITLMVGGSFIKVDASGVTISGPVVDTNSGGSPGIGSGAAPLLPGPLQQADTDKAGEVLTPALLDPYLRISAQGGAMVTTCGKQANGVCTREVCPCLRG